MLRQQGEESSNAVPRRRGGGGGETSGGIPPFNRSNQGCSIPMSKDI